MRHRFLSNHHDSQRGSVAIGVPIIAIAGLIIAIVGAVSLSGSSFLVTSTGERVVVVNDGFAGAASQLTLRTGVVAERGEIDVDGNDTILLSGIDELAVAKLLFTVEDSTYVSVDLTSTKPVEECPF